MMNQMKLKSACGARLIRASTKSGTRTRLGPILSHCIPSAQLSLIIRIPTLKPNHLNMSLSLSSTHHPNWNA